ADLVVLGETLTYAGVGSSYADCAETIPGPSTDYFGALAKKHGLYVVAGLIERDRHQLFNVAVLIGPDGKVAGKYRKVCLPDGEYDKGMSPGSDYSVFHTSLGRIGMMICYDGFFPEVARELSNRGAEIIAWPVWGCNPEQARAENRIETQGLETRAAGQFGSCSVTRTGSRKLPLSAATSSGFIRPSCSHRR